MKKLKKLSLKSLSVDSASKINKKAGAALTAINTKGRDTAAALSRESRSRAAIAPSIGPSVSKSWARLAEPTKAARLTIGEEPVEPNLDEGLEVLDAQKQKSEDTKANRTKERAIKALDRLPALPQEVDGDTRGTEVLIYVYSKHTHIYVYSTQKQVYVCCMFAVSFLCGW